MNKSLFRPIVGFLLIAISGVSHGLIINNGSFEDVHQPYHPMPFEILQWNNVYTYGNGVVTGDTAEWGYVATDQTWFAKLAANGYLSQDVGNWLAGDQLTFDWNFVARETHTQWRNDYSQFEIHDTVSGMTIIIPLMDIATLVANGGSPVDGSTGWQTYTHTFANAGAGVIGFRMNNVGDTARDSELLVDNLIPGHVEPAAMPAPLTIALMAAGLAGFAATRPRMGNQNA